MYPIFLETLSKLYSNGNDPKHNDLHQEGHDNQECTSSIERFLVTISPQIPHVSYILETLGKMLFNGDDPNYHDNHQECQDDQEYPPSTGRFLMTISPQIPHVSYIFGNLRQNAVQWR